MATAMSPSATPKPRKLVYALPAYNEAPNLPVLLRALEAAGVQAACLGFVPAYVIVDDGSVDATPRILEEWAASHPTTIITHSPNQGLGQTMADALKAAADACGPGDVVVTMDSDNTQPAGLIFSMLLKIQEGNEVVIASRYRYGAKVLGLAWHRHLMSWGAAILFRSLFPIPGVRDYTCGFRAYDGAFLRRGIDFHGGRLVTERGFQCMAEILLRLSRVRGYPSFVEVPMVLRYYQKEGASKMKVARTVWNTIRLLLRHRFGAAK